MLITKNIATLESFKNAVNSSKELGNMESFGANKEFWFSYLVSSEGGAVALTALEF